MRRIRFCISFLLLAGLLAAVSSSAFAATGSRRVQVVDLSHPAYACAQEIHQAEAAYGIPHGLLYAIGMVESGKFGYPWPWALNIGGAPVYANSLDEASQYMTGRVDDMAVGCMQVHMRYHAKQFDSATAALEPRTNVWYAASFLTDLRQRHGNWTRAVAHYHANNREAQRVYVCKVTTIFRSLNGLASGDDGGYCSSGWRTAAR